MKSKNKNTNKQRKPLNTLMKVLISLALFLLAFIVSMIVIFCVKGSVPDVLIEAVLDGSKLEAFLCAAIQITNIITGKKDKEKENEEEQTG